MVAKRVFHYWEKSRRTPAPFSPEAVQTVLEAYGRTEERSPARFDYQNNPDTNCGSSTEIAEGRRIPAERDQGSGVEPSGSYFSVPRVRTQRSR